MACISEMLTVIGVGESSDGVPLTHFGQKITSSVAPPSSLKTSLQQATPPVAATRQEPKPEQQKPLTAGPAASSQRRSLFDRSKYQPSESNGECCAERAGSRIVPSVSIVQTIDDAKPSSRKLALRNSSPDLRSPQPAKSLLKKDAADDDSSDSSTSGGGLKRSSSTVSFSNLEIREYNVALSDHPDCSHGPPIQLGWEYCEQEPVSVDAYEQQRNPRRRSRSLKQDAYRRSAMLNEAGYSHEELQTAMEDSQRVKQERRRLRGHLQKRRHQQTGAGLNALHIVRSFEDFFTGKSRRRMS